MTTLEDQYRRDVMNTNSPLGTAFLRGAYLAFGTFLVGFLPAWAVTDELKAPLIAGGLSALFALGFRGGAEGRYDARRQAAGNVKPSDVGQ